MSESPGTVIPEKCRRCPFLTEMRRAYIDLEKSQQLALSLGKVICSVGFDAMIESSLSDFDLDTEPIDMPSFRKSVAEEIDSYERALQETIELSVVSAVACEDGPNITEAVSGSERHVLSRCTSPEQIGGLEQPSIDYIIVPADIDWLPAEAVV